MVCLVLASTFYCTKCCAVDESSKTESVYGMIQDNMTLQDQEAIMAMCNETFRTPMGMLLIFDVLTRLNRINHFFFSHAMLKKLQII